MLANKRVYFYFALCFFTSGILIFLISLFVAFARTSTDGYEQSSLIYFNREILPDNVLYPLLMAADQLTLTFANDERKLFLQMDYALKRLDTSYSLVNMGKTDLAFITLGKAHQYLLQVNQKLLTHAVFVQYQYLGRNLNDYFLTQYQQMRDNFTDSQQANLEIMRQELLSCLSQLP